MGSLSETHFGMKNKKIPISNFTFCCLITLDLSIAILFYLGLQVIVELVSFSNSPFSDFLFTSTARVSSLNSFSIFLFIIITI